MLPTDCGDRPASGLNRACFFQNSFFQAARGFFAGLFMITITAAILTGGPGVRPASAADEVARAEAWFNSLDTLEARFTQVASDGSYAEGKFYLRRPHRSRFEFDDPVPLVLITSNSWIHVDEKDQQKVTSYPVSETPIAAMLSDPVRLTGSHFVTSSGSSDGIVQITLDQPDGEAAGRLVLEFTEKPFELRRWLVTDANGITTSVLLSNIVKGRPLAATLFVPTDYPDQFDT